MIESSLRVFSLLKMPFIFVMIKGKIIGQFLKEKVFKRTEKRSL